MSLAERFQNVSLWQRIALICLSALLGVLVYAPFSVSYLSLVAWVPFFLAISGTSLKVGTRLGFLYGVLFFGGTMGWLMDVFNASPWAVVPLVVMLSVFPAVWALGYSLLQKRFTHGWLLAVFAALWWGGVEFFRSELFMLKFSWMTPGMGFGPTALTSVVGVYGMSVLIVLAGLLVIHLRKTTIGIVLGVLIALLPFLKTEVKLSENGIKVLAVQDEYASFQRYQDLIAECEDKVDVILLPEYSFRHDVFENVAVMRELKEIAADRNAILIFGTQTDIGDGKRYNTAAVLDENGVIGTHYKNNPVHFFNDGEAGQTAEPVDTKYGKVGTPICFDNDYEDVVRRMAAAGANVFLVPSLDATHWGERQHLMHCEVFRHRAAESGKWFCVAAGSGMTQVIAPNGDRVSTIPLMEEGWMVATVYTNSDRTVYTQLGWLFPWFCLISGLLIVVYAAVSFRKNPALQT